MTRYYSQDVLRNEIDDLKTKLNAANESNQKKINELREKELEYRKLNAKFKFVVRRFSPSILLTHCFLFFVLHTNRDAERTANQATATLQQKTDQITMLTDQNS